MRITRRWKRLIAVGAPVVVVAGLTLKVAALVPDANQLDSLMGHTPTMLAPSGVEGHGLSTVDYTTQEVFDSRAEVTTVMDTYRRQVGNFCQKEPAICQIQPFAAPAPPATPPSVSVSVDGVAMGQAVIANAAASAMFGSVIHGQPLAWTTAYQRGVASVVMHNLLWLQAQADGTAVSDTVAQAFAQTQLTTYLNDNTPNRPVIAAGETPQDIFTAPAAVAAYREVLSIRAEQSAIATSALGPRYTPTQESSVLLRWFVAQLPSHSISVAGLPSFDLTTELPPGTI